MKLVCTYLISNVNFYQIGWLDPILAGFVIQVKTTPAKSIGQLILVITTLNFELQWGEFYLDNLLQKLKLFHFSEFYSGDDFQIYFVTRWVSSNWGNNLDLHYLPTTYFWFLQTKVLVHSKFYSIKTSESCFKMIKTHFYLPTATFNLCKPVTRRWVARNSTVWRPHSRT